MVNVEEMPREDRTSPKLQESVPTELPFKTAFHFFSVTATDHPSKPDHERNKQES